MARLDVFKTFQRFLWKPGDPCYPFCSLLKNICTQLMFIPSVKYRDVLILNTFIPHVFDKCCVFTIAVLNMSCTDVDEQKEPDVKNTLISEYKEFAMKLSEKVNKEVNDNEDDVKKHAMMTKLKMTKGCENYCCFPHCILNEHRKTVGTLDVYVELSKESLFPGLLDRAWDQYEDYKVQMFDDLPMVQDKLMSILHAVNIDLDQDGVDAEEDQLSFIASANTSDAMSI